ncbi:hypothetical protein VY88_18555 [Azospirillum thiophilum]|uniref:Uncharacterized protein n=1 Tax=Azospirillum thiophilum TaxID=528244 RepID=A0AAC9EYA7_9PROT|nr:hypothetical protein [Azospirillum thiophilum]ALG74126.1 hypothetical protein AL072_24365 [Azospirillum thiophilum]KJR63533.1 hypothetical protein VY88_18555 [Azospirillum thiophilum]
MLRKVFEALLRGSRASADPGAAWNARLDRIAESRPGETPSERSARIEKALQEPRPLPATRLFRNIVDYRAEHGGGIGTTVSASPPPLWALSAGKDGEVPLSAEPVRSASGDLELRVTEEGEDLVLDLAADYGVFVQGKRATAFYSMRTDLLLVLGDRSLNDGLGNIVIEDLSFDRAGSAVVRLPDDPSIRRALHSFAIEPRERGDA